VAVDTVVTVLTDRHEVRQMMPPAVTE